MLDRLASLLVVNEAQPWGVPVEMVDAPAEQETFPLRDGSSVIVGVNPDVARLVAQRTGDRIAWPFATIGFMGEGPQDCLVLVVHGFYPSEEGHRVEVSVARGDLPLSRPLLGYLAAFLFDDVPAAEVLIRVPPDDADMRRALLRLGFIPAGRELRPFHPSGLLYGLTPDRIPRRFRRWVKRFWH